MIHGVLEIPDSQTASYMQTGCALSGARILLYDAVDLDLG